MKITQSKLREIIKNVIREVAPKGWEGTVKAMKKHKDIDNPWALAWSMKNKGYKSHKRESMNEGVEYFKSKKKKEEQKLREMIRDMIVVVESDLPITTRRDKTVTVVHKRSGKELVITDTPSARKKYKRMGYLVSEANTSEIRKKLLKKFGDDPLYKEFILAKTPREQKKTLDTLKSIRGPNAVRLMQKYAKSLQKESIKEATKINIDDLLKNSKVKEIMKRLGISSNDTKSAAKIIQYFIRKPAAIKNIKI